MCKANERIEAWIIAGKMCNQIEGHAEVSILLQAPIYPLIVPFLALISTDNFISKIKPCLH